MKYSLGGGSSDDFEHAESERAKNIAFWSRKGRESDIPLPPPLRAETLEIHPEVSLEREWQRQAQKLADLFATELEFKTSEEYIATLPKFEQQPDNWQGRFDIPVIVETRVPLGRMLELAGIVNYFNPDSIRDWEEGEFNARKTPYTVWVNDGVSNLEKSVEAVRESLGADERGANIYDGIALYLRYPEILDHHYLDFSGSQIDSVGYAPGLDRMYGETRLYRRLVRNADPNGGSIVAGKL